MRPHDDLIAQSLSKIIVSSDGWLHSFQTAAPERQTKQQKDRVSIAVTHSQSRFAPLNFFHGMSKMISISTDTQCTPNATTYQNTRSLVDCSPNFLYFNRIPYLIRFKNLKYLQKIYALIDAFNSEVKSPTHVGIRNLGRISFTG